MFSRYMAGRPIVPYHTVIILIVPGRLHVRLRPLKGCFIQIPTGKAVCNSSKGDAIGPGVVTAFVVIGRNQRAHTVNNDLILGPVVWEDVVADLGIPVINTDVGMPRIAQTVHQVVRDVLSLLFIAHTNSCLNRISIVHRKVPVARRCRLLVFGPMSIFAIKRARIVVIEDLGASDRMALGLGLGLAAVLRLFGGLTIEIGHSPGVNCISCVFIVLAFDRRVMGQEIRSNYKGEVHFRIQVGSPMGSSGARGGRWRGRYGIAIAVLSTILVTKGLQKGYYFAVRTSV